MCDTVFWASIIDSLAWPIFLFIIVILFREQLSGLIARIKSIKGLGYDIQIEPNDTVTTQTPTGVFPPPGLPPTTGEGAEIQMLSASEIEDSKRKAQARIDKDAKKAGYVRGVLRSLPNGGFAVAWKIEVTSNLSIKG